VDKFVGDKIIGIFVPAMAGAEHTDRALDAARELLRARFSSPPRPPNGSSCPTTSSGGTCR
jgi:hypothetical protein